MSHDLHTEHRRSDGRHGRRLLGVGRTARSLAATAVVAAVGLTGLGALSASAANAHKTAGAPRIHHSVAAPRNPSNIVPAYGAYLGADPDPSPGVATATQAAKLDQQIHRPLALVSLYVKFTAQPALSQLDQIAAQGSIPFVSMHCGALDQSVANGTYDNQLRADAQEYKNYGGPILFRWFWEMNLPLTVGHPQCLGHNLQAHFFIAAYQHIWNIFKGPGGVGATNVYFVWNPSDAQHAFDSQDFRFYPGNQYVDWIGADLYDRNLAGLPKTFQQQFQNFYTFWTHNAPGKPMLIGETGSVGTTRQVGWLSGIASSMQNNFRDLKALVYFDATAQYNYILTPGPGGGLAYFTKMATSQYFSSSAPHVGYLFATSAGGVFTYETPNLGSEAGKTLPAPIVGIAYDRAQDGYWLVGADGSIYTFGKARYFGSMRGTPLRKPIVGMAANPDGNGYWMVASDGGIFSFGDAHFHGSMGGKHLNQPIVGMTSSPDGRGYWFVATDGGIFTFGTAKFFGSTGALDLNKPIDGMTSTPDAHGYWLVAADGGIFTFGDAHFKGSLGGSKRVVHIVGMSTDQLTGGYRMVTLKGAVYQFPGPSYFKPPPISTPVVAMDSTGIK